MLIPLDVHDKLEGLSLGVPTTADIAQLEEIAVAFEEHWVQAYRPLAANARSLSAAWQAGDIATLQREAVYLVEALQL